MSALPHTQKCVGIGFVSPLQRDVGQKCQHLAVGPTCRQHVGNFPSQAVVSVFDSGGKQVLILHTYVLRVQYSCDVVLFFWLWREIVFGVMYVLSVQYSCVVVSVFWLWQEIVLKMRTHFYTKILLGYFIMIGQPMCVFHKTQHSFTLYLSFLYISLVPCRFTS